MDVVRITFLFLKLGFIESSESQKIVQLYSLL